ncbi:YihY/virulence factor BrkB family protein [Sphingobium nicotianae]|uniref:YihY/virulence factor BrkB family protein n=1 Tax=Sphingobium nicotianae TaxID=2782607 RepID=A0A9X1DAI4_9SPHN|nr:YihY/virulence factor BrkB family protein [Sphingobium nicotianae]MBT2186460.1 YihY/virulence factor BrkB family protein [Sphingobium nicotianae]
MLGLSPQSPEERRKRHVRLRDEIEKSRLGSRSLIVLRRVAVGVYSDGFIHAGNLAYLTLVALFPFFILAAATAQLLGRTQAGLETVNGFLLTVPSGVANVLRPAIVDVLTARTGNLLWIGALVGLWTVGSLIETIRDILRRAYGTRSTAPFWHYRLRAMGLIIASVLGALIALSLQVLLSAAEAVLEGLFPFADYAVNIITATRLVPTAVLFLALYGLFYALTPSRYREGPFPKWPGALLTTLWWYVTTWLLPVFLANLSNYNLTYGGLAGAMIALIFFFIIGLGVVIGAELNAALADFPEEDEPAEETETQPA